MNTDTNSFEALKEMFADEEPESFRDKIRKANESMLVRPDGSKVPDHWPIFTVGEEIPIHGYVFKVAHIGEKHMLLEPVGSFKDIKEQRKKKHE